MSLVDPKPSDALQKDDSDWRKNQLAVRQAITAGSVLNSPFLIMNGLATVVASYGLLENSAAVIIGAMVIALLLGPILGVALSLVDGETELLKQALIAELAGAVLVLAVGLIIGFIHSDIPLTPEILARTNPNFLDLAIAISGGAAGAYATVSPKLSVGLVGVAIATALVPPLAACGICLSRGHTDLAAGAFVLFATNLVAIQCASSVVLFAFGFHKVISRKIHRKSFVFRLLIDSVLFLLLGFFLFFQLRASIVREQFEDGAKKRLKHGLLDVPGAYLADTRFVISGNTQIVVAVVRSPNSVTPAETAKLQALLPSFQKMQTVLHVRSLLTKETTAKGYLNVIAPSASPVDEVQDSSGGASASPASAQSPLDNLPVVL